MTTRWFGAPVQRVEDDRLLRGHGRFTDDIGEDALECCFVRSPYAHARIITSIDAAAARAMPGVVAVYTAADLPFGGVDLPLLIPHPNLTHGRTQRCLASDIVRYSGEAVAFVVAENRYLAEDAAELVQVEYEPLPVVITPEVAARAEHLVHSDVPGNIAAEMLQEVGDVDAAMAAAPRRKRLRFRYERGAASPMEARAVWARWSSDEHRLTVYDSTQSPTSIRGGLAVLFSLPESSVDVIAPDVGGGFGPKIMLFYPDELLVPYAAMQLGRPVKWTEDRQEHFTAVNQERGQVHEVEVGFDDEGRLLALQDDFLHDGGAYTPYGIILPIITSAQVPGPYRIPNYRVRFRDLYTNAVPTSPYRGAGRPHACFVMERTLDAIAADLGIDRIEVRRRNLIQAGDFPYDVGVAWQDGNTVVYDSGNYPVLLDKAIALLGPKPAGDHVGMGIGIYVEGTGEQVLTVPLQAVVGGAEMGRLRKVFVMDGNTPRERNVTLGLSNDRVVEVKDGLKEGEVVVLNPRVLIGDKAKTRQAGDVDRGVQTEGKAKGKGKNRGQGKAGFPKGDDGLPPIDGPGGPGGGPGGGGGFPPGGRPGK